MPMRSEWMWMNGKFIPWDEAKVHVFTHALHYGSSVFEGIRAYATERGPAIFRLGPHVERLLNSCKIARIPVPYMHKELEQAIIESVRRSGHASCYIRPLVFRGYESLGVDGRGCPVEVIIGAVEWGRYLGAEAIEQGVDVQISSWRRMAPDTYAALAKIGGQYVNSQFVVMEAKDNGFTEGIALDIQGYVSEGSGENIFVIHKGIIYTPPLYSSILGGITRDCAMVLAKEQGIAMVETPITREMLYIADEIFFTGTAAEITPVRSVDRIPIGPGHRGPITQALQEEFFAITAARVEDRHGWLTFVDR